MNKKNTNYYKICPSCSFFCHIKEPDEFCSKCGDKLILKCPDCQNKIDNPYANYCKFCGVALPGRIKEDKIEF